MSCQTQTGQSGGDCEAGGDNAIEAYVKFPFSSDRCLFNVPIMDVNGVDLNIDMVKTLLLQSRDVPDVKTYKMAFQNDDSKEIINIEDTQIITDFTDYLLSSEYTIVFLKIASGKKD